MHKKETKKDLNEHINKDLNQEIIEEEIEEIQEEESAWKGPLKYIIGLFLLLIILSMSIPYYSIKLNPEPKNIPSIEQVMPQGIEISNITSHSINNRYDILNYITPSEPKIKQLSDKVSTMSCNGNKICHSKAIFYFVRDNFEYISDPPDEYIKDPKTTIVSGGGDCDDFSVLLASMERSINIKTRLVFIPRHVYVQIKLKEAPKKYKDSEGWISLDPTCSYCEYGEIPYQNIEKEKIYLDIN